MRRRSTAPAVASGGSGGADGTAPAGQGEHAGTTAGAAEQRGAAEGAGRCRGGERDRGRLWRRTRGRAEAPPEIPDLAGSRYFPWLDEMEGLTLGRMAARLPGQLLSALRWAWRANRRDTAATIAANTAAGVLSALILAAMVGVLHELFSGGPTPERIRAALPALVALGAAVVLRSALRTVGIWAQSRLRPQVERAAETELLDAVTRVRTEAFDDTDFCDAVYRGRDRGLHETQAMIGYTVDILAEVIGLLAVASVVTVLHPILLPLLVVSVLPVGWAAIRSARMRYERMRRLSTTHRLLYIHAHTLTQRETAAELRSYGMRRTMMREYTALARFVQDSVLAIAARQTGVRAVGDAAGGAATLATYGALVAMLIGGWMPLAVAGAAYVALGQGKAALDRLVTALTSFYESALYFSDVLEVLDEARARTPDTPAGPEPGPLEEVELRDVVFAYPGADRPALDGVSLRVRRGEVVALVGPNGSGKTTAASLISGLFTPQTGTIAWNGADTAGFDPDLLRARIGTIRQQHSLWPFSARRNITMDEASDGARLERALSISGAADVVGGLRDGLDTVLDKRFAGGADLSGGQRQRIAGARGLYRAADLVIADEPTAALDAHAEQLVFDTLRHASQGAAVLLITHRLASVRMADRIVVLDRGRVAEQGTHAALLAAGGLYAELYGIQAAAYASGPERARRS
ncbi:ABC transporter ATP-binding protein [Nocardiopsis coralliicola]